MLPDNNDEFVFFLNVMKDAVHDWNMPVPEGYDFRWTKNAVPFKVILAFDENYKKEVLSRLRNLHFDI